MIGLSLRAVVLSLLVASMVFLLGCSKDDTTTPNVVPAEAELKDRLDSIISYTLNDRLLNSEEHNAWQVVHGIMAFGKSFPILHDGQRHDAVLKWAMEGGPLKGWGLYPAEKGVTMKVLDGGERVGAGHPDQWLGYMSHSGLSLDDKLVVGGMEYTARALYDQAMWAVCDNYEPTWTLMAAVAYLPTIDDKWPTKDGTDWNVEKMLDFEVNAGLDGAACGGSHRLFAIAVTVARYLQEKKTTIDKAPEVYQRADALIQSAIKKSKEFQQPDGSLSLNFFTRAGSSGDTHKNIYATGHTLECLVFAMNNKQFDEPWVTRAAVRMLVLLEGTKDDAIECGALYHAIHGLILYRQRRFGDATIETGKGEKTAAAPSGGK